MSSLKPARRLCSLTFAGAILFSTLHGALADEYRPSYQRGLSEMARKDYDGAINSFGAALGFDQTDAQSFFMRGQCFYHMGNYPMAVADFEHMLQLKPNNVDGWLWQGTTQSKLGHDDAATKSYLHALRLNPALLQQFDKGGGTTNVVAVSPGRRRGTVGMDNQQAVNPGNMGAVQSYARAIELFRKEGNNDISHGDTVLTEVPDASQDSSGSKEPEVRIEELNAAIRSDPSNAGNYFRRGRYYLRLKKMDRALSDFNDAIQLNPQDSQFWLARAKLYHDRQQPDLCRADILQAQNVDPTVPKNLKFAD
jgi:tetratricopeptide (TPR) repeat protein